MSCGKATTLLCLLLVLPVLSSVGSSDVNMELVPEGTRGQYQLHEPISIESDSEFTTENGVVSGSGTESDPYIIEGWDLGNASLGGVGLKNTTKHVTIKDCWFHDAFVGVSLINVKNATIERNIFYNNSVNHVALQCSDRNKISSNLMEMTYWSGIELKGDNHWNDILDNEIKGGINAGWGILFEGTGNNCTRVIGNEVYNFISGIHIQNGFNMVIRNNSCHHNSNEGLYLNQTYQTIIAGNNLQKNKGNGMCLIDSPHNLIFNNLIEMNEKNGVVTTANSNLYYNTISDNHGSGIFSSNGKFPNLYKNVVQGNWRFDAESEDDRVNISDIDYGSGSYPFLAKVDKNVTLPIKEVPIVGLHEFDFLEEYRECLFYYSPYDEGIDEKIVAGGLSNHRVPTDWWIGDPKDGIGGIKFVDSHLYSYNYTSSSGPHYFIVHVEYESGLWKEWNVTMNYIPTPKDNVTPPDNEKDEDGNTTDDPSDDNDTMDQNWTRETNRDPINVSIGLPEEGIRAGKAFILTASSFDLDLAQGDSVRYEWFIDGIGLVGEGDVLNITLDKGTYTIRLRAIDKFNGTTEVSMVIEVGGKITDRRPETLYIVLLTTGLISFLCIFTMFIYRRERKRKEGPAPEDLRIMDLRTPAVTPHTFEGGPVDLGIPPPLSIGAGPPSGPLDVQLDSVKERMVYSELESFPFEGVKRPKGQRRRELRRDLKAREDRYDGEVYSALRSILYEE